MPSLFCSLAFVGLFWSTYFCINSVNIFFSTHILNKLFFLMFLRQTQISNGASLTRIDKNSLRISACRAHPRWVKLAPENPAVGPIPDG